MTLFLDETANIIATTPADVISSISPTSERPGENKRSHLWQPAMTGTPWST